MIALAVIPARAASKGLPHKNVAAVAGRPLIAWTIGAARAARTIARVIVSTDSPAIAAVAREWGADVPFLRPSALGADDTPGIDPILHAIEWLDAHEGYRPDAIVALQPTSPLRTADDIDAAVDLLARSAADAVVSVALAREHPYWMKRLEPDGRLIDFLAHDPVRRRQDLPPVYSLNGAIYAARRLQLIEHRDWYAGCTLAYVMPAERSLDIDSLLDLQIADRVLRETTDAACR